MRLRIRIPLSIQSSSALGPSQRLRSVGGTLVVILALVIDLLFWGGASQLVTGGTLPTWVVPAVTTAVYASLMWRWRRPVHIFAMQWIYALAGLVIPGYAPVAGLLVALHAVACRAGRQTAVWALSSCAIPFGIDCYIAAGNRIHVETSFAVSFSVQFFIYAVLTLTVWGLGRLAYEAERRSQRAQQHRAAEAVQRERLRLARELHDIVAHAVSAMILQAAGARTLVGTQDEQVRQSLAVIEGAGVQAMTELHRLLGLLRSANPDRDETTYGQQPRLEDISQMIELSRASGLDIDIVTDGPPGLLDPSVDLAAYRIVQEALTNSTRYAGQGAAVRIRISWSLERLTITVRDTPGLLGSTRASADLSSGHGLDGLNERVRLLGGLLDAGPAQDGGFLVRAVLPVRTTIGSNPALAHPVSPVR